MVLTERSDIIRQSGGQRSSVNSARIVADDGCDLSIALATQYLVEIVPVFVRFGQEMVSSRELTLSEFWARAGASSQPPGSSAPGPGAFHEVFLKLVSAGHDVVCLTLPSLYSSSFNSAWVAAQDFGEQVRVVDSRSFSLGMGLEVIHAAQSARAGCSAEAIQAMLEDLRGRTSVIFALDTLEWVRRGGRLARILPLLDRVARKLSVKPVLEFRNGDFRLLGVARSGQGALQRIEDEARARAPLEGAAAAYTRGCRSASDLARRLSNLLQVAQDQVLLAEAGAAFAVHAGPGALGAAVIRA
jgi:DegV family protein with EDD domain